MQKREKIYKKNNTNGTPRHTIRCEQFSIKFIHLVSHTSVFDIPLANSGLFLIMLKCRLHPWNIRPSIPPLSVPMQDI